MSKDKNFSLSQASQDIIKKEVTRYETKLSCLIPCLYQIQKEKGYIPDGAVSWLSKETRIPTAQIQEVLMFYTLFNKKPVGKFHVQVCCNVSCAMQGSYEIFKRLCKELDVKEGEISQDARWTVSRVECLGACDQAPVIQVNDNYFGNLQGEDRTLQFLKGLSSQENKKA